MLMGFWLCLAERGTVFSTRDGYIRSWLTKCKISVACALSKHLYDTLNSPEDLMKTLHRSSEYHQTGISELFVCVWWVYHIACIPINALQSRLKMVSLWLLMICFHIYVLINKWTRDDWYISIAADCKVGPLYLEGIREWNQSTHPFVSIVESNNELYKVYMNDYTTIQITRVLFGGIHVNQPSSLLRMSIKANIIYFLQYVSNHTSVSWLLH